MTKLILAIGKVIRLYCPRCNAQMPTTVTETADGWETWTCQACGNVQRFRTK